MSVSRRKLLQHSIFAIAACAAGPLPTWAHKSIPQSHVGGPVPDRKEFLQMIGSGFQVTPISGKGSAVWLRLLAVTDLPALVPVNHGSMAVSPPKQKSAPVQTHGFMLSFLGALPKPLPQGTYDFEHPNMGKFSLLIVPNEKGSQTYTAVINLL